MQYSTLFVCVYSHDQGMDIGYGASVEFNGVQFDGFHVSKISVSVSIAAHTHTHTLQSGQCNTDEHVGGTQHNTTQTQQNNVESMSSVKCAAKLHF